MTHMPSYANAGVIPSGNAALVNVTYVATGIEGTDFMVPIGATMKDVLYGVYWSPKGVVSIPFPDLPDAIPSDRTTTAFRVLTSAQLTAGDKLAFLIVEAAS